MNASNTDKNNPLKAQVHEKNTPTINCFDYQVYRKLDTEVIGLYFAT